MRTEFVHAIDNETNAVRTKLLEEYYVVIDDLEPSNSSVTNPTHYTFDTITSASGGFVGVINELILILLLCVYMLYGGPWLLSSSIHPALARHKLCPWTGAWCRLALRLRMMSFCPKAQGSLITPIFSTRRANTR